MRPCANGCAGALCPSDTSPTFTRRGSQVEVTIYHVPVERCATCGQEYMSSETSGIIDDLLGPFHGHGGRIPDLPPAKILIDFPQAAELNKAA